RASSHRPAKPANSHRNHGKQASRMARCTSKSRYRGYAGRCRGPPWYYKRNPLRSINIVKPIEITRPLPARGDRGRRVFAPRTNPAFVSYTIAKRARFESYQVVRHTEYPRHPPSFQTTGRTGLEARPTEIASNRRRL